MFWVNSRFSIHSTLIFVFSHHIIKGTVSLARIWCFLPFSAMIVRALQERSYEKNRGNYLTYESSLQSYDTHESTYKWLSLIRWLMYRNDIILTSFHLFRGI